MKEEYEQLGEATVEKIRQFVARIERLEAEKAELADDIREVYSEAKSFGFDTKILRELIKQRKADPNDVAEFEALFDIYRSAVDTGEATPVQITKVVKMPGT